MSRRCVISALLFFGFTLYFSASLSLPFFTRGEAREALVVQAMTDQHNVILPLRNGVDIPSKPPLFHWAGFAFSSLLPGSDEFALRLPSALASALALAAFFYFFAARFPERIALLAILALASSLDWLRCSIVARVDMMFTLWVSLSTWLLFVAMEDLRHRRGRPWSLFLLAGICMGFAALTKGPAGIALPGAVAGLYAVAVFPWRRLPVLPGAASALIGAAVASMWYFAAYQEGGQRFLDVSLMRENVARIVGMDDYEVGHESGPLTIIPMIVAGLLPWSFYLIPGLGLLNKKWRKLGANKEILFGLIWAGFYLVFFACTASKRNVYLLPSYPAYAFLFALGLEKHTLTGSRAMGSVKWLFSIFSGVLALLVALLLNLRWVDVGRLLTALKVKPHDIEAVKAIGAPSALTLAGLAASVVLCIAGTRLLFRSRAIRGSALIGGGQLLLALALSTGIMDRVAALQTPRYEIGALVAPVPEGERLYQFHQDFYAVDYYLDRVIPTVQTAADREAGQSGFLLVAESELDDARREFGPLREISKSVNRIIYGKDRLVLLKFP